MCQNLMNCDSVHNKALHLTAIPLRSIAAGELLRWADNGEEG